jgi:hypothetical protein
MTIVRFADIPILPVEEEWIVKLTRADTSSRRVASVLRRSDQVVRSAILRAGIPARDRLSMGAINEELEKQAAIECEEARDAYRAAEQAKQQEKIQAAAVPADRVAWRYITPEESWRRPVPITLRRVFGLLSPIERGQAHVWSLGGRERSFY